jgi:IclR family pca regulon transcriptional regulator
VVAHRARGISAQGSTLSIVGAGTIHPASASVSASAGRQPSFSRLPTNYFKGVGNRSYQAPRWGALVSRDTRNPDSEDGPDFPTLQEPRYSQSVERGLAILGCFSGEADLLGIAEMADLAGMSRSTTHRYAITLVELGFLEQRAGSNRKYRLGCKVTDLGMAYLDSLLLRRVGRPILEELRRAVLYTVSTAVLQEHEIVLVDRLRGFRGDARLKLALGPGCRLPAYCTGMGKVLLANLPENEQKHICRKLTLPRRGPNTITTKTRLATELEQVAQAGFAIADEELSVGVRSIAVPVRGETGLVIGAVNIAAPTSMIRRKELSDDFGPELQVAAERMSQRLGAPDSHTNQHSED